jgi:hypothetical protein
MVHGYVVPVIITSSQMTAKNTFVVSALQIPYILIPIIMRCVSLYSPKIQNNIENTLAHEKLSLYAAQPA